eukprot:COSAG01_NODE_1183_length_11346_cov_263.800302_15_plen_57_part_00
MATLTLTCIVTEVFIYLFPLRINRMPIMRWASILASQICVVLRSGWIVSVAHQDTQ